MTAAAIVEDIGPLLTELNRLGVVETASEYDAELFGDYFVDFRGPSGTFRITRDRSQYIIDGDDERLKSMGLFRAFDSREQFYDAAFGLDPLPWTGCRHSLSRLLGELPPFEVDG